MTVNETITAAILNPAKVKTITATFTNGATAEYSKTREMFYLLSTDPATVSITDTATGKRLYTKQA